MAETVFLASFKHESQTFTDELTDREDFKDRLELFGDEIPATLEGTNSEVGGIIDIAQEAGVDLVFSVATSGGAGPPVSKETYEYYTDYITETLSDVADRINGVILPLHGAMVPEHLDDGEGPLVERVREIVGESIPIVVTIDPNANVSDELVKYADAIVAYEETPHIDMGETGRRGMRLLVRAMNGEIEPVMHIERPPVIPSAVKSTTLEPPMTAIHALAREFESRDDVLKANVCQGFWSADIPHMGFSIVSVADGRAATARDVARELAELVWDRREAFVEETVTVEAGVALAKKHLASMEGDTGPVVIAEMHDNPGGGAPADGTKLLRELIDQGVTNTAFAIMCDPDVVSRCIDHGVGERLSVDLGGRSEDETVESEPIEALDGYVKVITDGRYVNTGPMLRGAENSLGRAVRLRCGTDDGIDVIVTENRVQPWDAEVFRHVGIIPERLDIIAVKSAVHYRTDFGPMASEIVSIDESPSRTFERISRPKYPLDSMDANDYPDWT